MSRYYLEIDGKVFPTKIAITPEEQIKGLMYEEWPPPNMAFIYSHAQVNRFWMKNCPSPLDIIFCFDSKIVSIKKGEPYSTSIIGDYVFTDLVVEMPYGTCDKFNITTKSAIKLVKF